MIRVENKFEPQILQAIDAWEKAHSEEVTWDASIDFLPDARSEEDTFFKLVPAVGIYLEIAGPQSDQVISNSFYFVPYLPDWTELAETITKALDSMLAQREEVQKQAHEALVKSVKKPSRR